jgi:hypothetical protein
VLAGAARARRGPSRRDWRIICRDTLWQVGIMVMGWGDKETRSEGYEMDAFNR